MIRQIRQPAVNLPDHVILAVNRPIFYDFILISLQFYTQFSTVLYLVFYINIRYFSKKFMGNMKIYFVLILPVAYTLPYLRSTL